MAVPLRRVGRMARLKFGDRDNQGTDIRYQVSVFWGQELWRSQQQARLDPLSL